MIKSINEILQFLQEQADLRAPENDEAGCILNARATLIDDLRELELDEQEGV